MKEKRPTYFILLNKKVNYMDKEDSIRCSLIGTMSSLPVGKATKA
jgi:hypothetical protein